VYPLKLATLKNGQSLYIPDQALVKTTYQKLVAADPTTLFPYWAKVWASSDAIVQFLLEEPGWIQNKKVLEIGAGIGVPSLSIATQAHKIIVSDYAPEAVMLLQKNIEYLKLTNVLAQQIDWNNVSEDLVVDTILLSDTNYEPHEHNNLVLLIEKYINTGSTIIVATPNRLSSNPFLENVSKYMYCSKNYRIIDSESLVEIIVMVLKK
jgi:predicted nicotinamide N-methyase